MDPITIAVLAALAGGVGGEVGRQAWTSLTALVGRRPAPATPVTAADEGGAPAGASEIAALEAAPGDQAVAGRLERALRERAAGDAAFERSLRVWSAGLGGGLAADPDAAAELQRAVDARAAANTAARGEGRVSYQGDHIDFSHGAFTGPGQVVGKIGTQYHRQPPR
jgi:hypothetical protein